MKIRKALFGMIAMLSSAIVVLAMPLSASAEITGKSDVTADTDNIYFSSAIPSASAGSVIINCLGYLVTIKDASKNEVGTVFVHDGSFTGRAYYTGFDRKTGKIMKTSDGKSETEIRIPVTDIISEFSKEYGDSAAQKAKNIFSKKISGVCSLSTIMCTAQLESNSIKIQDGWSQELKSGDTTFTKVAYTQVRLKQGPISAKTIMGDLSILNSNSSYEAARAKSGVLQSIEVNPSVNLTNGGSVLSVTNGTDALSKQFGNLNSNSAFKNFQNATKSMILYSYYNVNVVLTGVKVTTPVFKPGKVGAVEYTVNDSPSSAAPALSRENGENGGNTSQVLIGGIIGFSVLIFLSVCAYAAGKSKSSTH